MVNNTYYLSRDNKHQHTKIQFITNFIKQKTQVYNLKNRYRLSGRKST